MSENAATATSSIEKYKSCIIASAEHLSRSACGSDPRLDTSNPEPEGLHVIGLVSLLGELEWTLLLGVPRKTAGAMAEQFTGFPVPFDSQDMCDAVGEFTNMFVGQMKVALEQRKVIVEISLPSVVRTDDPQILGPTQMPSARLTFATAMGPFWVQVLEGSL